MTDNDKIRPATSGQGRKRISQADIPLHRLEDALRIPRSLVDHYGSDATRPLDVASALELTPNSSHFRTLCGASLGYGLTDGGPKAPLIGLTPLGRRALCPTEVGEDARALRDAAQKPVVAQKFYTKYDGSPLPPKHIAQNVLATFGVPADRTATVYDLLIANADFVGISKTIKDKVYVDLGAPAPSSPGGEANFGEEPDDSSDILDADDYGDDEVLEGQQGPADPVPAGNAPSHRNAIFVGHGSNHKPMEQLVKILDEYGIPNKQAIAEPNRARPIPQKVAEVMQECGAAVLVFTADKEYFDKDGNSIWRPSENVHHELGAASVLYGDRVVIFKEVGIDLPSNFSSRGYIEFEKDRLNEKGVELFRELVAMKILKVSVG